MIYMTDEKFPIDNKLFSFNDINFDSVELVDEFSIKNIVSKNDEIFLFNPSFEQLSMFINLKKNVYLFFDYVDFKIIELIRSNHVKKVIIIDEKDKILLQNQEISKFELVYPLSSNLPKLEGEWNNRLSVFTHLRDIQHEHIDSMVDIFSNECIDISYHGLKVVENDESYEKLMRLLYGNIDLINAPTIEFEDLVEGVYSIIDIQKNEYPIFSLYLNSQKRLPFLYSSVYRKWLKSDVQNPKPENLGDIFKNEDKRNSMIEENFSLHEKIFSSYKTIEEIEW
jgi:hypothetical protein